MSTETETEKGKKVNSENVIIGLGVLAGFLQLIGFAWYNNGAIKGSTATWILWTFLTTLNTLTYTSTTGDISKSIMPATVCLATWATLAYSLINGKFGRLDLWDWPVVIVSAAAGLVWWRYQSAASANFIVVAAIAISFIPLYRKTWNDPRPGSPWPWYVWSLGYVILATIAVISWNGPNDLVYPVSMLPLHLAVGFMIVCKTQKRGEDQSETLRNNYDCGNGRVGMDRHHLDSL